MIGIYKIVNKINQKVYIGQSIHCGKRLDEHCKGKQFIDEVIQVDGVENFSFEILKTVEQNELNYWEDYFIMKFDCKYPKGYNKRWNTNEGIRKEIQKKLDGELQTGEDDNNYICIHTQTKHDYQQDEKITSKQWLVYYYLLSISYYDSQNVENHRYVYKKDIKITSAAKFLRISRPTFYTALEKLQGANLLRNFKDEYLLYARNWTKINKETLQELLKFSQYNPTNIDLLRTYLILKKISELAKNKNDMRFTRKDLIKYLGHDITTAENYQKVQEYLMILSYFNFIKLKSYTEYTDGLGKFIVYYIQEIKDQTNKKEELDNIDNYIEGNAIPSYIVEKLSEIKF